MCHAVRVSFVHEFTVKFAAVPLISGPTSRADIS